MPQHRLNCGPSHSDSAATIAEQRDERRPRHRNRQPPGGDRAPSLARVLAVGLDVVQVVEQVDRAREQRERDEPGGRAQQQRRAGRAAARTARPRTAADSWSTACGRSAWRSAPITTFPAAWRDGGALLRARPTARRPAARPRGAASGGTTARGAARRGRAGTSRARSARTARGPSRCAPPGCAAWKRAGVTSATSHSAANRLPFAPVMPITVMPQRVRRVPRRVARSREPPLVVIATSTSPGAAERPRAGARTPARSRSRCRSRSAPRCWW